MLSTAEMAMRLRTESAAVHEVVDSRLNGKDLTALVRQRFSAPDYRPLELPSVAVELLALSRRPNNSLELMSQFLEKDALLAGTVLRIAQSAIYASSNPPRTLREAVVRLGVVELRNVLMEAALNLRVFRLRGFENEMNCLRRHSTATAHMARLICRRTSFDPELGFLCGLLHDVGVSAALSVIAEDTGRTVHDPTEFWQTIGEVHEEAGEMLAILWKLPPDLRLVLGGHHRLKCAGIEHPLRAILMLAEELAQAAGHALANAGGEIGRFLFEANEPAVISRAKSLLSFNDSRWEELQKAAAAAPPVV